MGYISWLVQRAEAYGLLGFRATGGHGASSTLTGPKCVGHDSSRQSAVETPSTSTSGTQNIQDNRYMKTVPNRRSCPNVRPNEWLNKEIFISYLSLSPGGKGAGC